jgi:hypothetical protein
MDQRKLELLNKSDCIKFFEAIARVSDTCILTIHKDGYLSSLVSSPDNTLILYAECNEIESTDTYRVNIPDIKRLVRVIDSIDSNSISLKVNTNNLEYRDTNIKFKYHLFDEGFLTLPSINIEKVKNFETNIHFKLTRETLQNIIKSSTFTNGTNNVYFYDEQGRLKAELTDRSRHNTDMIALDLGECDYKLNPLPINLDNIKLLALTDDGVKFGINTQHSVMVVENKIKDIKLKYIITSLVQ